MRDHPNMKHLVKNRILCNRVKPFIIKSRDGFTYYQGGGVFTKTKVFAFLWEDNHNHCDGYFPFFVVKKYDAEVFIETTAGDIKVIESDFP